jgi:transposase
MARNGQVKILFTPCNWKTCFDVSIPMRIIWSMDGLLCLRCNDLILAQRCRKGPSIPTAPAPPGPNVINNHIAKRAPSRHDNALGRSRGGYGTKACVITDGLGRAIAFRIAPGQAHELPEAIPLVDSLPSVPAWVVADRGYSSHSFRDYIWSIGNVVERLWARLKEWRAVATRYEKTARSFMGVLCLAAAIDCLKR